MEIRLTLRWKKITYDDLEIYANKGQFSIRIEAEINQTRLNLLMSKNRCLTRQLSLDITVPVVILMTTYVCMILAWFLHSFVLASRFLTLVYYS